MSKLLIGLDEVAPQYTENDFLLAKDVAYALNTVYPGYLWVINVDGGMLNIRNLMLSAEWGKCQHRGFGIDSNTHETPHVALFGDLYRTLEQRVTLGFRAIRVNADHFGESIVAAIEIRWRQAKHFCNRLNKVKRWFVNSAFIAAHSCTAG